MGWLQGMLSRGRTLVWAQMSKRTPSENAFLALLPLVGLIVGLTTVITTHLIAYLQKLFWGSGINLLSAAQGVAWPLRVVIPLTGGLIVAAIGLVFKVETRGGGITTIIQGLSLKGGVISVRRTWPRDWAAVFTLATGGSLGREGAVAMLASALASNLGRRFRLSTQQLRLLVCAAAAGALAAVYNAPIGGALFALEILMGNFALDVLGPVVVVTVISTLVFRSAMGNLPRFEVPQYQLVSSWELLTYAALGIFTGLVAIALVRALFGTQDLFEKLPLPVWAKPALGMALVGTIGIWWPHVYGNGFEAVNLTLREQLLPLLVLVLLPMKMLATSLAFGSGAAGGLFTPSLMVGALAGSVFGWGVHSWFPHHTADRGAYALVAMGGLLAGTTHAPLTAMMMIFEQTNSYQIILPLMLVCVISHLTVRMLHAPSMEEESLQRRGIKLPRGAEAGVMQTLKVGDVMHDDVQAAGQSLPFADVVERFLKEPFNNLYVVNDKGRFLGAIRLHSLKEMLHQAEALTTVVALDLVDEKFQFVTPDDRLADTMDEFWNESSERLPVVNNADERQLIGWVSKRDLIGVYSQEILSKRQLLSHFVTTTDGERRDVFVELPEGFEVRGVEVPPHMADKTLAQLAPRSQFGVHVIAIKRRNLRTGRLQVEMPTPHAPLNAGDRLVVIGTFEAIAQFMAAIAVGIENEPE